VSNSEGRGRQPSCHRDPEGAITMIRTTRTSTTVIPNFRAHGLITSDHDLGGAMSQSLP
jgi:hypothetical protein